MKLTVTFNLSDDTLVAISERMWPADEVPRTRRGLATRAAISQWLADRVLQEIDEMARVYECTQLGCDDTDDDHDHADGPKRAHEDWCSAPHAPGTGDLDGVRY